MYQYETNLRDMLLSNPKDENTWLTLGTIASDKKEQIRCLQRVIELNPKNMLAWLRMVSAADIAPDMIWYIRQVYYLSLNEKALRNILSMNPKDEHAWFTLGIILTDKKEQMKAFQEVIELIPKGSKTSNWTEFILTYARQKLWSLREGSKGSSEKIIDTKQSEAQESDTDNRKDHYRKVLELDPKDISAWIILGELESNLAEKEDCFTIAVNLFNPPQISRNNHLTNKDASTWMRISQSLAAILIKRQPILKVLPLGRLQPHDLDELKANGDTICSNESPNPDAILAAKPDIVLCDSFQNLSYKMEKAIEKKIPIITYTDYFNFKKSSESNNRESINKQEMEAEPIKSEVTQDLVSISDQKEQEVGPPDTIQSISTLIKKFNIEKKGTVDDLVNQVFDIIFETPIIYKLPTTLENAFSKFQNIFEFFKKYRPSGYKVRGQNNEVVLEAAGFEYKFESFSDLDTKRIKLHFKGIYDEEGIIKIEFEDLPEGNINVILSSILDEKTKTQKLSSLKYYLSPYINTNKIEESMNRVTLNSCFNILYIFVTLIPLNLTILDFQKDLEVYGGTPQILFDTFREIKKLFDEGIITKEEFEKTKSRLLNKIQ